MEEHILTAFILSALAGLSTCLGAVIIFFTKKTNKTFLSFGLGLSAGVMIYVSLVEFVPSAIIFATDFLSNKHLAGFVVLASFFVGAISFMILDKLIPTKNNPHTITTLESFDNIQQKPQQKSLLRIGILTAVGIGFHNLPEGMATFVTATVSIETGILVAIAVALHNIPEGIAVALPIYSHTKSKKKAFLYTFYSGITEPIGALSAYLILAPFLNEMTLAILYGFIAGLMVIIALDELLPSARVYGKPHISMYGVLVGMILMGVSLVILTP